MKKSALPPSYQFSILLTILAAFPVLLYGALRVQTPQPRITSEQAITLALNDLVSTENGLTLDHPRHTAEFTAKGLHFTPKGGGPEWHWQLTYLGTEGSALVDVALDGIAPETQGPGGVAYLRGAVIERYLFHQTAIEQQFVIPQPLPLAGHDLVIDGTIASAGTFETTESGWLWRTTDGAVRLGDVRVYDAQGVALPAKMTVTAGETRIVVDGTALVNAVYPVIVDPEIGTNDFRISDMGPDGDPLFGAFAPAVAYNLTNNEYLVVWHGDDVIEGESEIYGQRLDATTGMEVGLNDFRISDMGPNGDINYDAYYPAVAFNVTNQEYLIVWYGDDANNEEEIYGQRIDAFTGVEIGANDFRISDMGNDGNVYYGALYPAVAYNNTNNEYLVVWRGEDDTPPLINEEWEVFGQRIDAFTGLAIGTNDFRISDIGPNGNDDYDAFNPSVAYNPTNNEYLVVWYGDDFPILLNDEFEIFGQRLNAATGTEIGTNDFRISDMGPGGDSNYDAFIPSVAYDPINNEYLVVWYGDDNTPPLVNDEIEIFGQRINAAIGTEIGVNDFRISDMGPDGDFNYGAYIPAVVFNVTNNEYLVIWRGDDNTPPLVNDNFEIFGQQIDAATGSEIGVNDFRLSDLENYSVGQSDPAIIGNPLLNEYLAVWECCNPASTSTPTTTPSPTTIPSPTKTPSPTITPTPCATDYLNLVFGCPNPTPLPCPNDYLYLVFGCPLPNHTIATPIPTKTPTSLFDMGMATTEMEIYGQLLQLFTITPTPNPMENGNIYLPIALRPIPCFPGPNEQEPNNSAPEANGPLCFNQDYFGTPGDNNWDYFFFTLNSPGTITIDVTNHPLASVGGAQVQLHFQSVPNLIAEDKIAPYQIPHDGAAGIYYVVIYHDISKCVLPVNCEVQYTLRVSYTPD